MSDVRMRLVANWCDNDHLRELWNRMTPNGDYRWNELVVLPSSDKSEEDYFVVINCPKPIDEVVASRSIVFSMEARKHFTPPAPWNEDDPASFDVGYFYGPRNGGRNNIEWHLARTYRQLMSETVEKTRLMSSVTSGLTYYPGHRLRYQFLGYLDARIPGFDLYGRDRLPFRSYRGFLPYYSKDAGLFPYKYTFAAENTQERNYFTEKLVDAVLSECLCFYWGCPNIADYIDPQAYCRIDIGDPAGAIEQILTAIDDDEWGKRIEIIRREKVKILNELQFFPTLERIVATRRRRAGLEALEGTGA